MRAFFFFNPRQRFAEARLGQLPRLLGCWLFNRHLSLTEPWSGGGVQLGGHEAELGMSRDVVLCRAGC
jgi:hypothetical protein